MNDINQNAELGRTSSKKNTKKKHLHLIHIIFKLHEIKDKEKNLKETRKTKALPIKRTKIWIKLKFSSESMQAAREGSEIFKLFKGKKLYQPRILYSVKLFFKSEREIEFLKHKKIKGLFFPV